MLIAFAACQESTENIVLPVPQASPTITPTKEPTPGQDSPIRRIDFKNFRYVGPDDYAESFTLKDGKKPFVFRKKDGISLIEVKYADLTGDGDEEAIITMGIQTGGSASHCLLFVYAMKNGKPQPLLKFITGDRADGGLKDIFQNNGELVVELFGVTNLVNGSWKTTTPEDKKRGDCCPTLYTRTKFKWNGIQFVIHGSPEVFDIPQGN